MYVSPDALPSSLHTHNSICKSEGVSVTSDYDSITQEVMLSKHAVRHKLACGLSAFVIASTIILRAMIVCDV